MAAFLRAAQVRKKTGLTKTDFYARIKSGTFPTASARLGERRPVWLESTVDDWIDAQLERSRRKPAGPKTILTRVA